MSHRSWRIRLNDILHAARKTLIHTRDLDYDGNARHAHYSSP